VFKQLKRVDDGDKAAIILFLQSLNDNGFDITIPASLPGGLHPGGNFCRNTGQLTVSKANSHLPKSLPLQ